MGNAVSFQHFSLLVQCVTFLYLFSVSVFSTCAVYHLAGLSVEKRMLHSF